MLFYEIRNRASGTVLDVPGADPAAERVQQFGWNGGTNQQWAMVPVPDTPLVNLVCRSTGRALSVADFDAATWAGQQVLVGVEPYAAVAGQSWSVFAEDDGFDTIDSGLAPIALRVLPDGGGGVGGVAHWPNEMVLDIPGGRAVDGGDVQLFPFNGGDNQRWEVQPVDDVDAYLIVAARGGKVLDVPGFSRADEPIQQYDYNGGPNQLWRLLDADGQNHVPYANSGEGAGPVSIVSVETGKSLGIDEQGRLAQAEPTGHDRQLWLLPIRQLSMGGFSVRAWVIENVGSGLFLAVDSTEPGAAIGQTPDAGFDTPGWWFPRADTIYQPHLWI